MEPSDRSVSLGCVVGRFQPFHRDHLTLVEQALAEHGHVVVAVTNADPSWRVPVEEAPHRHTANANPFSYEQRVEMILAATVLIAPPDSITVVPFPIQDKTRWLEILPAETHCWVRQRGPWEQRKIAELSRVFHVRSVPAVPSEVSGSVIRRLLATGDESWRDLVVPRVADLITQWRDKGMVSFTSETPSDLASAPVR
jgi:nicotinamide-nucleotide adenylyltransferase